MDKPDNCKADYFIMALLPPMSVGTCIYSHRQMGTHLTGVVAWVGGSDNDTSDASARHSKAPSIL